MMQLLLHGPATNASRIKLQELRSRFHPDNVVVFEKGEELGTILTNLQSSSLFDGERLVVMENPSDDLSSLIPDSNNLKLILWFDHEVDIKKWSKFQPQFFPEAKEVSVFPFLDCLVAGDRKAFLEIEKLKNGDFDIYYLITMVFYRLRTLAVTPKNASSFIRDKLQRQRKVFTQERIIKLYKEILEIDFKIKSGLLEKPQAEFLLVEKFIESPIL
mgnify:CR=1 FL=1